MPFDSDGLRGLAASFEERGAAQVRRAQITMVVLCAVLGLAVGAVFYAPLIAGYVTPPESPVTHDNTVLIEYYKYLAQHESSRMIAVLAVRAAITITLLFFVQILWTQFRYGVRLAVYYSARADCLLLVVSHMYRDDGLPSVDDLILLFSPTFDFGRTRTPTESAVDLARVLLTSNKLKS